MAGNQTQLTQSDLDRVSQQHTDVAQQVSATQKQLQQSIETLTSSNHGEMMKSLQHVNESWQKACSDVVKNLEEMAQKVKQAGQHYGDKDSEVAQRVQGVAGQSGGKLQSFMGQ